MSNTLLSTTPTGTVGTLPLFEGLPFSGRCRTVWERG
ncbi:hypothetical protein P3T39_002529 [Kitasatospora sp. GP82]|nr:hypothetical protein [Kitasatospora sp. GP82]